MTGSPGRVGKCVQRGLQRESKHVGNSKVIEIAVGSRPFDDAADVGADGLFDIDCKPQGRLCGARPF